jgi:hypothetical protein
MKTEPESYNVLIPPAPRAGTGLHEWSLKVSRDLLVAGYNTEKVIDLLAKEMVSKGRPSHIAQKEAKDETIGANKWLAAHPWYVGRGHWLRATKPGVDSSFAEDFYSTLPRMVPVSRRDKRPQHLPLDKDYIQWVLSSFEYNGLPDNVGEFDIGEIFANINFIVCATGEVWDPYLMKLDGLVGGDVSNYQYTVPSPFVELRPKLIIDGEVISPKSDANVSKRMYQVVEFDKIPDLDHQAQLLLYLEHMYRKEGFQLAMIVYSGSKSLHGWFTCYHANERLIRTFFQEATKLGADPRMKVPSQYCRMPGGENTKTGREQPVIYYRSDIVLAQAKLVRKVVL